MKHWQNYHVVLTATSIPVALLICWWIFRKNSNVKQNSKANSSNNCDSGCETPASAKAGFEKHDCNTVNDVKATENLDENIIAKTLVNSSKDMEIVKHNVSETMSDQFDAANELHSLTAISSDVSNKSHEEMDIKKEARNLPSTSENPDAFSQEQSEAGNATVSETSVEVSDDKSPEIKATELGGCNDKHCLSQDINTNQLAHGDLKKDETGDGPIEIEAAVAKVTETNGLLSGDQNLVETVENDQGVCELLAPVQTSALSESVLPASSLSSNTVEVQSLAPQEENYNSAVEKNPDRSGNVNNSNNAAASKKLSKEQQHLDVNGSEDSGCDCCKTESDSLKHPCTNGWHTRDNSESGEDIIENGDAGSSEGESKQKSSVRPRALPRLSQVTNPEENFEVLVEFPSERVGLLIGKLGRNIKQLKQDSGADIYVKEVTGREDIQVLQICGTQSEVESCVCRIKRRFNDVSLNHFDAKDLPVHSSSSVMSPDVHTPQSPAYPVANFSQLSLPEGVAVEVRVSAISDVDCVFVQQRTHPTFHALTNLEQAMALCYADPNTPTVPFPAQVSMVCALQRQGIWYRAQIVQNFDDDDDVVIRFIDYGGYETVPLTSLKQIRADFITLPFQAIQCYLDNIAPPNDEKFCEESVKRLQEMLQSGPFQARVTGYRSDGCPRIHLLKCVGNDSILINQQMAADGLASWMEPAPFPCP